MEIDTLKIYEKLKKSTNEVLIELRGKLEHLNTMLDLMLEIKEIENLESLCCYSAKEIIDMLNAINSPCEIDVNELEASLYFYTNGISTESFKKTKRFIDASKMLAEIKSIMDKFIGNDWSEILKEKTKLEDDIEQFNRLVELPLNGGKLIGEILPLQKYEVLVNSGWSEDEKVALYSMLVKSHIEFLKTERIIKLEEEQQQEDEKIEEASEQIATIMSERMGNKVIAKSKLDVSKEILEQVNALKNFVKKYKNSFAKKFESHNFCDTCNQFKLLLDKEEVSLDSIRESFLPTDFNLFLVHCLSAAIEEFEMVADEELEESALEFARVELEKSLSDCEKYAKAIAEEEFKVNRANQDMDSRIENVPSECKIVFYTIGDGASEFEKANKNLSPEGLENVRTLIKMLYENDVHNSRVLSKGNSKKVRFLNYGNVFIMFRMLFDNHILIYSVENVSEINKKTTDNRLNAYNPEVEKRIDSIIREGVISPDGTIEYRKLMEQSKKIMSNLNVKIADVSKGGFHV